MEQRESNAVFGAQPSAPLATAPLGAADDLFLDLPIALVPIPSLGKVYSQEGLKDVSELAIRVMTVQDEDILRNTTLIKKGTVISELLQKLIMTKVNVRELLAGDRNALLVAARIASYGSELVQKIKCPSCAVEQEWIVKLDDLHERPLQLSQVEQIAPFTNQFSFTTPRGLKIVFKFLTGGEEEQILSAAEMKRKAGLASEDYVFSRIFHSVISINGHTDRAKINNFIRNMPASESLAFRKHLDSHEPEMDMTAPFACKHCDHTSKEVVAQGHEFFWPSTRQR